MNESLTNRQIAFILFGVILGYGVIGLPKDIAEKTGTGGWITLLIATAIMIFFTYIITYLGYVHQNKTIYEYSKLLTGKYITTLFMSIYIIEFFMFFTMEIRIVSEVIKLTVLIKTPVWALSLLIFLVAYYTVIKRLRIIARLSEFYGILIFIAILVIHYLIFTQGKLINTRPFLGTEDTITYFKASILTILPFLGVEIITIIPFDRKKNTKKVFKYTILMIGSIGLLYIIVVESCVSVMGVDGIVNYKDALFATIRRIDIESLQFLRRLDGIFLPIWIMAVFCTITIFAYGTVFLLSKWFKKTNFNFLTLIVFMISFFVYRIPKSFDDVQKVLKYTSYLGILTIVIIPGILFIITKVKKYDKKID